MRKSISLFSLCLMLLISLVLPSTSSAEWKYVVRNSAGDTFYIDFKRIRKHLDYVYWWDLTDLLKPTSNGFLSAKVYKQGNCEYFRYKILSYVFHKQPMGRDIGKPHNENNAKLIYPSPNATNEILMKAVCNYAKEMR